MKLDVIVPSPYRANSTAHRALLAEGVEHREHVLENDFAYGRLLTDYWMRRRGFIIVEHDIAPWPGAIDALRGCSELLCGHMYPLPETGELDFSLGCTAFSNELVEMFPNAPYQGDRFWENTHWSNLDGMVFNALEKSGVWLRQSVDHREHTLHLHRPPVAHVRLPR